MRALIKSAVRTVMRGVSDAASATASGRFAVEQVLSGAMERTERIRHRGVEFVFARPNALNHFRVETFATKEPETLDWIDTIPRGATVWDVGANVGLYASYAAKARGCRVFAFEPSVFNLELLARNIHLNGLTDRVTIIPLPLSGARGISTLNMTTTDWGGALSTFGESYGFDGQPLKKVFEFRTMGISMDEAVSVLDIPQPDYIKMDVDGIEHLILGGGRQVLSKVKGMSVEINDAFEDQARDSSRHLEQAGLRLVHKKHSEMIENSPSGFERTFNQVWERPVAGLRNGAS